MQNKFQQWVETEGKEIKTISEPLDYVFQYLLRGAVPNEQADIVSFDERFLAHYHSIDCTQIQQCFDTANPKWIISNIKHFMRRRVTPHRIETIKKGSADGQDIYYFVKLQVADSRLSQKR
jgi:hypothetical protein